MNIRLISKVILFTLMVVSLNCEAQVDSSFPGVNANNLPGAEITTERLFKAESLFGYMNGGAELYLEYGFTKLAVTELRYKGSDFKVEVFHMRGREEAYGIYSVSIFKCDRQGLAGDFFCESQYQYMMCKGDYYINVINNSGTPEGLAAAREIGLVIGGMVSGDSFDISDFFPENDLSACTGFVLVKGDLGLYNGALDFEDMLGEYEDYTALIANKPGESLLSIRFGDETMTSRFLESFAIPNPLCVRIEVEASPGIWLNAIAENWIAVRMAR